MENLPEIVKVIISTVLLVLSVLFLIYSVIFINKLFKWLTKIYINSSYHFKKYFHRILNINLLGGIFLYVLLTIISIFVKGLQGFSLVTEVKNSPTLSFLSYFLWVMIGSAILIVFFTNYVKKQVAKKAKQLISDGEIGEALKVLEGVIHEPGQNVSDDVNIDCLYSYILLLVGEPAKAIAYINDSFNRMEGSSKLQRYINNYGLDRLRWNEEAVEYQKIYMASVLCEFHHYTAALNLIDEEKIKTQTETEIFRLRIKGTALTGKGSYYEARDCFYKAIQLTYPELYNEKIKIESARIKLGLGNCLYLNKEFHEAKRILEVAKSEYMNVFSSIHPEFIEYLSILAKTYLANSDIKKTAATYENLLNSELRYLANAALIMNESNLIKLLEKMQIHLDLYLSFIITYCSENRDYIRSSLTHIMQRKGLSLRIKAFVNKLKDVPESLKNELKKTKREIIDLSFIQNKTPNRIEIEELYDKLRKIELELSKQIDRKIFPRFIYDISIDRVVKNLFENELLVEFININFNEPDINCNYYVAYVLPNKTIYPEIFVLGKTIEIDTLIYQLHDQINNPSEKDNSWIDLCENLYSIIIKPWIHIGEKYRNWIFSLDTNLNIIPFYALINSNSKYLIENNCISIISSVEDLLKRNDPKPFTINAVLIGNPDFNKEFKTSYLNSLGISAYRNAYQALKICDNLPETKTEISAIKNLLSNEGYIVDEYTEDNAVKSNFLKVDNPNLLHVATHAFFLETKNEIIFNSNYSIYSSVYNPGSIRNFHVSDNLAQSPYLNSGIILSGFNSCDERIRSIVTAEEILSLDLSKTDLVILSACNTARGFIARGEGAYALHRAFLISGCRNVIASTWSIRDDYTCKLMNLFYINYLKQNNKSESLRNSILQLLKKYNSSQKFHPTFWASFNCYGVPD